MAENSGRQRELSAAVEDALRAFPLAPAPPTLLPGAMARVVRLSERPRFHVSWLEWAVGLFVVLMGAVTAWVVSFWLPGDWLAWAQGEGTILWQTLAINWVWAAAVGGALMLLVTMVTATALACSGPQWGLEKGV